jgi:hypothetical protein
MSMILVAGPYRSAANFDPLLIAKNVEAMTEASLALVRAGPLPVMGEWCALSLVERASTKSHDLHPAIKATVAV